MVAGTTVYPSSISLASTFDEKIAYQIGKETAIEVRAHGRTGPLRQTLTF